MSSEPWMRSSLFSCGIPTRHYLDWRRRLRLASLETFAHSQPAIACAARQWDRSLTVAARNAAGSAAPRPFRSRDRQGAVPADRPASRRILTPSQLLESAASRTISEWLGGSPTRTRGAERELPFVVGPADLTGPSQTPSPRLSQTRFVGIDSGSFDAVHLIPSPGPQSRRPRVICRSHVARAANARPQSAHRKAKSESSTQRSAPSDRTSSALRPTTKILLFKFVHDDIFGVHPPEPFALLVSDF